MNIEKIVRKCRDNAQSLGWKSSDGGITAWIDDDNNLLVSVEYNPNKLNKKRAFIVGEKLFGKGSVFEILTPHYTDEPFIVIKIKELD